MEPIKGNRRHKNFFVGGEKFGRWTALGQHELRSIGSKGAHKWYEKMVCECGNVKFVDRGLLWKGDSKSCGCLNKEIVSKKSTIHGESDTKFYESYQNMQARCNQKNSPFFKNYGGRGIICEWKSYESFKNDMYKSYSEHYKKYGNNTVLDRINVDGNYCKENCRWITREENAKYNTRNNREYLYGVSREDVSKRCGLTKHRLSDKLYECCGNFNIFIQYLENRFNKKWPFERKDSYKNRSKNFIS